MRKMKDSGIKWIGEIPRHWEVHPVYTYFGERKNKNKLGKESNLLSLSYGRIIRKDINTNNGLLPESFNTYNIVEAGDIIIRPTDLQNDKRSLRTGLVKEHGIITSAYIDLCPIKKLDSRYFHFILHTYDVMKVFYNMGNGVRQGLNYSEFSHLMVFEPSYNEQIAIANYLDDKIKEVDIVINQKQDQLSVLEQYKKSLIYEYVTGKKDVELKDSGIEWIGEISKEWGVTKIKFCADIFGRIGFRGYTEQDLVDYEEDGAITLSPSNFRDMKMDYSKCSYISWKKYKESPEIMINNGDVLLVKTGSTYGKSVYVYDLPQEATINPQLIVFKNMEFDNKLFAYILQTKIMEIQSELAVVGGTIPTMSQEKIYNFVIPDIPKSEQHRIANFLDAKCLEIDAIINDKKEQLNILNDYKKSLIYEYVTGKKEVPNQ